MMYQNNISFAGAGRVAEALCKELFHAGYKIDIVVTESEVSGQTLADSCNATWSPDLLFPAASKVIIVAVSDHKLKSVLESISCSTEAVVAHTAGSIGLDVFPQHIGHKGIFYPLQTFSKGRKINFIDLPFLLECSDDISADILKTLAESIGGEVHFVDDEQRRMLHLSAVFACNFTNHMLTLSKNVALQAGFPFDILASLINETFSKAIDSGPENSQTGPAMRNDQNTIEKHLELLSFSPEMQKIYNDMTLSIIEYYRSTTHDARKK
jgi:predicted short-subunit dehydrogenase-like oxidoreductase (DUF2520 family)